MAEIRLPNLTSHKRVILVALSFIFLAMIELLLIVDVVHETFGVEIHFYSANHTLLEWIAVQGLGFILIFVGLTLWRTLQENRKLRAVSGRASGEFLHIMVQQMREWGLTESELEIATMLIKGLTIQEIASIRMTKAGTIKSQCNAVYRKANVSSRSELAAYFLEDLMNGLNLSAPGGATIIRV
ncbi:LuxR C-terminal-related transcriptional regulator [Thalassospiraceae bacterium LMO-JJ14]|nr:LuxR C-terminal-related transcriptional regulator [Thalassospiraceae bacterium LMO-JJ14]